MDKKYQVTDYLGRCVLRFCTLLLLLGQLSLIRHIEFNTRGAYGVVCSVTVPGLEQSYAIKKCKNIFDSVTLAKRTLREIRYLRVLDHDNVSKFKVLLVLQVMISCFRL